MIANVIVIPTSDKCDAATGQARKFGAATDVVRSKAGLDRLSRTTMSEINGYTFLFTASSSDAKVSVTIIPVTESHGFICKPRLGGDPHNGGWAFGLNQIKELPYASETYPLKHNDKTSASIVQDADGNYEKSYEYQQYGNIDWKGKRTSAEDEPDNTPVLTWKGPPGRSVPYDYSISIPGLTAVDIRFSEFAPEFYTCFGSTIYANGEALNTIPVDTTTDVEPRVLGCALYREAEKMVIVRTIDPVTKAVIEIEELREPFYYLVAVVNTHYSDRTGFFDEIWFAELDNTAMYDATVDDTTGEMKNPFGWRRMTLSFDGTTDTSFVTGRPTACYFFNQSGTACTKGLYEYKIDWTPSQKARSPELPVVTRIKDDPGECIINYDTGGTDALYQFNYSGLTRYYSDYSGDTRITSWLEITGGTRSWGDATDETTWYDAPLFYLDPGAYGGGWTDLNKNAPLVEGGLYPREKVITSGSAYYHTKDRTTTLKSTNGLTLEMNKRDRNYRYSESSVTTTTGGRWIIVYDLFTPIYYPFFTTVNTHGATLRESYQTLDAELFFLDLRTNTVAYNRTTRDMSFEMASPDAIPFKTSYDDVYLYPFIKENAPIIHNEDFIIEHQSTRIYISRDRNQTHGYWDGIRLAMPVFGPETEPRPVGFTYNGEYFENAADVDWYWQFAHKESDGDMWLFYADWIKAVGIDPLLDAREAEIRTNTSLGIYNADGNYTVTVAPVTNSMFTGSVAVGISGDVFYSIFRNNKAVNGFIGINGSPEGEFTVTLDNINVINKPANSAADGKTTQVPNLFYPVAPIQTLPISAVQE